MFENLENYIEEYINNEIDYINRYYYENCKNDIVSLRRLQKKDIQKIANKVDSDYALRRVLEETVHYYLYQYISGKNKEEN